MLQQPPDKKVLIRILNNLFMKKSAKSEADSTEVTVPIVEAVSVVKEAAIDKGDSNTKEMPLVEKASAIEEVPTAKKKLATRLARLPKGKIAFGLGLLGASSGLAFTQAMPDSLQATILPAQTRAEPLRQTGDPEAQAVLGSSGLFLTNEIFYRKIEAIAQVPRSQTSALTQEGAIAPTASGLPVPTDSDSKDTSKADSAKAKAAQKAQAEQVIAAAPPAPKAAAPVFAGTTIDSVLEMRVSLARDVEAIAFATSSSGTITDLDGNPLKTLTPETSALAEIGNGIVVDGETLPTAFWVYPEDGGYVAVGNSWYRGRVLVALRERGLIAVNYVLLGDYLYSVVGSEMSPNWSIESLKAQAVAARSYALTHNIHPASDEYFDLDNTQRFQAYKGIDREANTTQAAVQSTAGEFISHEGGIVESLYAASQDIVDDAHKGSGMSQLGARDLAEQGYSYAEILSHYYPGTALGRIETDHE